MNKEILFNCVIIILGILYLVSVLIYGIWSKSKKKSNYADAFKSFVEITGVIASVVAIVINSLLNLLSYKAPELHILIRTQHGMEWTEEGNDGYDLPFTIDSKKTFSYNVCNAQKWFICIENTGNISADDVAVEISFDDVLFPMANNKNKEYSLKNFQYGTGCFNSIYREVGKIQPGEEVMLPQTLEGTISYAELFNKDTTIKKNTVMHIKIYLSNGKMLKYSYKCVREDCLTEKDLKEK